MIINEGVDTMKFIKQVKATYQQATMDKWNPTHIATDEGRLYPMVSATKYLGINVCRNMKTPRTAQDKFI